MPTATKEALDRVYAPTLALLKSVGFKRNGRTLYRHGSNYSDVINLQASQWNTADSMKFTANVGVHQLDLASELQRQRAALPQKVEECMLQERIGWVMPDQRDVWWCIDAEHTEEHAATSLSAAVGNWVLPWYEQCRSRGTLIQFLSSRSGWGAADMLLLLGERDLAISAIDKIDPRMPGRAEAIAEWKSTHGIAEA
jgi:hypothetical protein